MTGSSGASRLTGPMICAPEHRVGVHRDPLLAGQLALLQEDVVGHADLADVVQEPAPLQGFQLRRADTRICRPMSTLIIRTCCVCLLVNGSRLSTASASAPIVCVNISRISTKR